MLPKSESDVVPNLTEVAVAGALAACERPTMRILPLPDPTACDHANELQLVQLFVPDESSTIAELA